MLSFIQYVSCITKEVLLCLTKLVDPYYVNQDWILHSEATVQYELNKISHLNEL